MHTFLTTTILFLASLTPTKTWVAPDQPIMVDVKPGAGVEATLVLTDFAGKVIAPNTPADIAGDKTVNVKDFYGQVNRPGAYVLYLTKKGAAPAAGAAADESAYAPADFIGTPLVINVRADPRPKAPPFPIIVRVEPLRYVSVQTPHGPMSAIFYYDVAPTTVRHFQALAGEGYYDGLTFHRILPGFVIQGGDPLGNSTGGPGFTIDAEFSNRKHTPGVLSMARSEHPDSAGSQFFICLDYATTKQLDNKYTAFGAITEDSMETAKKIAAVPLVDPKAGTPKERQVMEKVELKPVTAAENPYVQFFQPIRADTAGGTEIPAPAAK
jgi:peptidyl-prolyl cis-trans isomerase B (cyclophilin B)